MTTEELTTEVMRQRNDLRRKMMEPAFVILDKMSYLALDLKLSKLYKACCALSVGGDEVGVEFQPSQGHVQKFMGMTIIVAGSGTYVQVVAEPHIEAMRLT